ncbi:MAG: DUF3160 domain-containing protein [Prolixibacteraceae bacterium]|jgi:hypothetical protein|nr:DUF3160 domain-containing protein [Prolixibacteraceae bacterium]
MRKLYFFATVAFCIIQVHVSKAQIDFEAYNQFKSQTINLTSDGLETLYPRSSSSYFKGYNKTPDFDDVAYLDSVTEAYSLTSDELNLLVQNHFFVTERQSHSTFAKALHDIYINDLPVFVSTDIILDALHRSYSYLLKTIERSVMSNNLESFLGGMYNNFPGIQQKYNELGVDVSLEDVDLYVSVAWSLISDQKHLPHIASVDMYNEILDNIESHSAISISLFCKPERKRKLDFSQFEVRGHYVYSETDKMFDYKSLEPYFKAQMWLGRIEFFLTKPAESPWEEPWGDEEIRRMNISAFLLNELADMTEEKQLFAVNEQIINYLVGASDNITPEQYASFLNEQGIADASQLNDNALYNAYYSALSENEDLAQLIMGGQLFSNPYSATPDKLPVSYRLSGQRYVLDSHILSNMVYDRIIYNGKKIFRGMPDPLDALFALGNNDSYFFLNDELEAFKYASNLANMRYLTDHKEASFWTSGYYSSWLGAIRCLNTDDSENLPFFMRTSAWHQQKMNTQLASWAQLRHDNVLYAKPSYTGMTGCSYPYSYVEPYPEFYRTIANFTNELASFLNTIALTDWESINAVATLSDIPPVMEKLEAISIKELSRTPLSTDEKDWLKQMLFEDGMSGRPPYSGWYSELLLNPHDMLEADYPIVDIHTQPTLEGGQVVGYVLHVATGKVNIGTFIVENSETNSYMAYTGPFFSYYDTITIDYERLTDEDWLAIVEKGDLPARPQWTEAYLADEKGSISTETIELPSEKLIVLSNSEKTFEKIVKCYPNPVESALNVYFPGNVTVLNYEIFSSDGKRVAGGNIHNNGVLDFSSFKKGLYLLHFKGENIEEIKKIVKYTP